MKAINKNIYSFILFLFFFLNTSSLLSQQFYIKSGLSITSNFKGIRGNLPFWLHSNKKSGSIYKNSANISKYVSFYTELFQNDYLNIKLESKLINRLAYTSSTYLETGFIEFEFRNFEIIAGRFYDPLSIKENNLSIGSFMFSKNALPIPKVLVSTKDYFEYSWD